MTLQYIHTDKAPLAVGPYSQAVKAGNLVFVSGQMPVNPASGEIITSDAASQARQCLKNVMAILGEAGMNADHIVRMTVYLKDMDDFASVNEVYATFFEGRFPARVCVEVSRLPKDVGVEIDAIASF
jgi:2-iminobutanoate/2-iminopropanoate deaminase